jgi:hypothetical protein
MAPHSKCNFYVLFCFQNAGLFSAMSDSPAAPPHASLASTPRGTSSPTFLCHDYFLGRDVRYPIAQQQQSDAPLKLIKPATWFLLRQRCAALGTNQKTSSSKNFPEPPDNHQPPLPTCYTQVALWPAQRVRVMFSCSATVCHRLSAAQAACANVTVDCQRAWRQRIQGHVMACYVCKIQVES